VPAPGEKPMTTTKNALPYLLAIALLCAPRLAPAALTGKVMNPEGSAIADAPIRLRNEPDGIDLRTYSDSDGRYEFADVSPGTYLLTVSMPCCLYYPYANDAVQVARRGTSTHDVELVYFNIDVEGDNPAGTADEALSQRVVPNLPVPRAQDGHPDLTGTWLPTSDPFPEDPKLLEWAAQDFQKRAAGLFIDTPSTHCLPGSPPVPGGATFTAKFVQRPELLVILFEDVPGFRQVFLDGRSHPDKPNPTWMGHSIGRWEGDTLVVDTVGFNDRGLSDNYARTTMLRTVERFTRKSYGELEVEIRFDDPGVFEEPWTQRMVWQLAPQIEVMEYVCENNPWIGTTAEDVGLGQPSTEGAQ